MPPNPGATLYADKLAGIGQEQDYGETAGYGAGETHMAHQFEGHNPLLEGGAHNALFEYRGRDTLLHHQMLRQNAQMAQDQQRWAQTQADRRTQQGFSNQVTAYGLNAHRAQMMNEYGVDIGAPPAAPGAGGTMPMPGQPSPATAQTPNPAQSPAQTPLPQRPQIRPELRDAAFALNRAINSGADPATVQQLQQQYDTLKATPQPISQPEQPAQPAKPTQPGVHEGLMSGIPNTAPIALPGNPTDEQVNSAAIETGAHQLGGGVVASPPSAFPPSTQWQGGAAPAGAQNWRAKADADYRAQFGDPSKHGAKGQAAYQQWMVHAEAADKSAQEMELKTQHAALEMAVANGETPKQQEAAKLAQDKEALRLIEEGRPQKEVRAYLQDPLHNALPDIDPKKAEAAAAKKVQEREREERNANIRHYQGEAEKAFITDPDTKKARYLTPEEKDKYVEDHLKLHDKYMKGNAEPGAAPKIPADDPRVQKMQAMANDPKHPDHDRAAKWLSENGY